MRISIHKMISRISLAGVIAAGGVVSSDLATAFVEEPKDDEQIVVLTQKVDESDEGEYQAPKVWLGIMLKEIEGDLARYLGTEEGILVDSVFPESPAAEAGIEEGDVLQQAGEAGLTKPIDLMDVLQKVDEGGEVEITLLRKGEEVTVAVKPAPRPEMAELSGVENLHKELSLLEDVDVDGEQLKGILKALRSGKAGEGVDILRLGGPSMIWRGVSDGDSDVHGDMDIVIVQEVNGDKVRVNVQREDDSPAKITVTEGDDVTVVTEENIDELPEHILNTVKPLLKGKTEFRIQAMPKMEAFEFHADHEGMAEKVKEMLEKHRVLALESTKKAHDAAEKARVRVREMTNANGEVEKLKAMVEDLQKEVQALRSKLEKE